MNCLKKFKSNPILEKDTLSPNRKQFSQFHPLDKVPSHASTPQKMIAYTSNKKEERPVKCLKFSEQSREQILSEYGSRQTYQTAQSGIQSQSTTIDFSGLLFNVNDDRKTLIQKNVKLRGLIVQMSNELGDISRKYSTMEEEYRIEKTGILNELDKITNNYRTYAESYKNLPILEEEFRKLREDYNNKYKILIAYQDSLSMFVKDYMGIFALLGKFLNDKNYSKAVQFISTLHNALKGNLYQYKPTIDMLNIQDITHEYTQLIANYSLSSHTEPSSKTPPKSFKDTLFNSKARINSKKQELHYNYPVQENNQTKSTSKSVCNKIDQKIEENLIKNKSNENMELNMKNCYDYKELNDSLNSNTERTNSILTISKESFMNNSNVSNVFEKNIQPKSDRMEFSFHKSGECRSTIEK